MTTSVDDHIGVRDWRRKPPLRLTVPRARQLQRVSKILNHRDIMR